MSASVGWDIRSTWTGRHAHVSKFILILLKIQLDFHKKFQKCIFSRFQGGKASEKNGITYLYTFDAKMFASAEKYTVSVLVTFITEHNNQLIPFGFQLGPVTHVNSVAVTNRQQQQPLACCCLRSSAPVPTERPSNILFNFFPHFLLNKHLYVNNLFYCKYYV